MRHWVSDHTRDPNHYAKECQHESHQSHRKPRFEIDENGNCRKSKRDRRKDRPKHLVGWHPLWNQAGCLAKQECLTQRKGNRTDSKSKACQPGQRYCRALFGNRT